MPIVSKLAAYALRQVIGEAAEQVVSFVQEYVTDHGQTLPRALAAANDHAWQAVGVALAGDRFCDKVKRLFTSADDKGFREQVTRFLNSGRLGFEETPLQFRQKCLDELHLLRKGRLLSAERLDLHRLAEQTGHLARYGDTPALVAGAWEAVHGVAGALAGDYPNLATLLGQTATGQPPLLASAFAFFFRREVETNPELARGLTWDTLRQLSAAQEAAFADIEQALVALGGRFDEVLDGLGEIKKAVLDLHIELQSLAGMHQAGNDELRRLMEDALNRASASPPSPVARPMPAIVSDEGWGTGSRFARGSPPSPGTNARPVGLPNPDAKVPRSAPVGLNSSMVPVSPLAT